MIINHNLNALNAHRQLGMNTVAAGKSMEKLSSGLRINRAGDDAAGLAISEKMRGQIRGLEQASRNAQDGISMIQTAEGALNETHSILQRMRELAVQAANDTNVAVDRDAIQNEIDQLAKEITRISDTTEFNKQKLLNGTFQGSFQIGANEGQQISVSINNMGSYALGVAGNGTYQETIDTAGTIAGSKQDIADGKYTVGTDGKNGYTLVNSKGDVVATSIDGQNFDSIIGEGDDTYAFGATLKVGSTVTISNNGVKAEVTIYGTNTGLNAGIYTYDQSNKVLKDENGNIVGTSSDDQNIIDASGNTIYSFAAAVTANKTIDVGGVDVTTNAKTTTAMITTINNAIEKVSSQRATLGAIQNRLEHTINNLNTSAENLQSSESRIRDVDMAKEMMNFSKNNILAQAAQAMLAQANQQPQGVLQLLR
ncbi:flagellin [Thermobrachium celere]|uniref:Flagellin n=1 Tax=Thermobrachium celere DSM 8682 TaxID=941824 RepID=R7RN94_9CLOT|nr:flagellin [Thermobrachium celere]CDF57647.1 Flagellin protein FlaA [Thermobrachium celere DSM 8682]